MPPTKTPKPKATKPRTAKPAAARTKATKARTKETAAAKSEAKKPRTAGHAQETAAAIRRFALDLPGAYEEFPWGERVAKVNKKVFVFLGKDLEPGGSFSFSVKLPASGLDVLALPFAEPTGYGLGKSGWVTIHVPPDAPAPIHILESWIEESYRAIAPKKLVTQLVARQAD